MRELIDQPHMQVVPWAIVIATCLVGLCLAIPGRRPFNPVIASIWLFGLIHAAWIGRWSAVEINIALLAVMTPHMLITVLADRRKAVADAESVGKQSDEAAAEEIPVGPAHPFSAQADAPETPAGTAPETDPEAHGQQRAAA